jgi:hypothetical protein
MQAINNRRTNLRRSHPVREKKPHRIPSDRLTTGKVPGNEVPPRTQEVIYCPVNGTVEDAFPGRLDEATYTGPGPGWRSRIWLFSSGVSRHAFT